MSQAFTQVLRINFQFSIFNCLHDAVHSIMKTFGVLTTGSCVVGLAAATALDELGSLADHLTGIEA